MDFIFSISDAMKNEKWKLIIYNIVIIYQKTVRDDKNSIEEYINGKLYIISMHSKSCHTACLL